MIKKAFAALAIALTVLAPQAGHASETYDKRPVPVAVTTTDQVAAARVALRGIERRLAADPALARQVQRAAGRGDSAAASQLLSADGTDVVAVGSSSSQQLDTVRIRITITVYVRVWGTVCCGSVTVTVDV